VNAYFLVAGLLTAIVGLAHSVLGEVRIFRQMRKAGFVPTEGGSVLSESHVRILWATWHATTAFGCGFGVLLLWLALPGPESATRAFLARTTLVSMLTASLFVLVGTKGKHPGWLGLVGVAVLTWLGLG
jgi:hypothetical protein